MPGNYGGFETLAENLVQYHEKMARADSLTVYCSAKAFDVKPKTYRTARLQYIDLEANGPQSIAYDMVSMFRTLRGQDDCILVLGVSGALALPVLRVVGRPRIITNIDGIEWKRSKWKGLAKFVLRLSEWAAVRFSHVVIADNQAISDYVTEVYGVPCEVIPYGGDHALGPDPDTASVAYLPEAYALALCRIEPENNVAMILEAFASLDTPLVFVGNWDKSAYGRGLKAHYSAHPRIIVHDPIYEPGKLRALRDQATIYVHGHSAGGTNPSLVEMMHFGIPVLAHDCSFNRHTTEEKAVYFLTADELAHAIQALDAENAIRIGADMREIACRRYTWDQVGQSYFSLCET